MTHEYVIALGGSVQPRPTSGSMPTAVAWAADRVLAVGPDDVVRAISRGDSTFLDVRGCAVTALAEDPAAAEARLRAAGITGSEDMDVGALLVEAGLLDTGSAPETGSPADLAFWDIKAPRWDPAAPPGPRLVAVVRGGTFTEGDARRGPFPDAADA